MGSLKHYLAKLTELPSWRKLSKQRRKSKERRGGKMAEEGQSTEGWVEKRHLP